MKITKIVLTGGPGSGKTTMIEALKSNLKEKGYKVIVVNETARELAGEGMATMGDEDYVLEFQDLVLKTQVAKEKSIENFCKNAYFEDVVILYDRGTLDNKAYLKNEEDFDNLLTKNNLKEIELYDKYNLVINLKSAANLGEEFYKNDEVRKEKNNEAILLDYKTTNAWVLSPNLKIIEPTVDIEEKIAKVTNIVDDYLTGNYEITDMREKLDGKIKLSSVIDKKSKIIYSTDYYINSPKENVMYIVTKRLYKGHESIILKEIKTINGRMYLLNCMPITNNEFLNLRINNGVIHTETKKEVRFQNIHGKVVEVEQLKDGLYLKYDKSDYDLNKTKEIASKIKKLKFDNK